MATTIIHSNIKNKETVYKFVNNLQKELNIHRLNRFIEIRFLKKLEEEALGYCWGDHEHVEIEICRDQSWKDQMITLAHEMVHAKQFLRKELVGDKWKKRNYSKCQYDRQPWEISAYLMQDKLYNLCYPE
jgi:spermidine/putrescine-binding protein|tara:strand:- start:12959 stop:13348 length:390 start_codon:yes stop_codon:yes gene_type:complete